LAIDAAKKKPVAAGPLPAARERRTAGCDGQQAAAGSELRLE
jgi:hypothetical protein